MTPDFYKQVLAHARSMQYGDKFNLRNIFKNYRNGKGLSLTKFGVLLLTDMGIDAERFILKEPAVFTAKLRTLLDKYNKYPYYITRRELILYGSEDIILYKLYGSDLDSWIDHMETNID
jgi:hypothetical protein